MFSDNQVSFRFPRSGIAKRRFSVLHNIHQKYHCKEDRAESQSFFGRYTFEYRYLENFHKIYVTLLTLSFISLGWLDIINLIEFKCHFRSSSTFLAALNRRTP